MKKLFVVGLIIMVATVLSFAQTTAGRLTGTVSGPDGLLPNAKVVAKDNKTGKEQTTTSNGDGTFAFPLLEFGTYTVTITADGFKTFVANELKIDVGREYSLPATLEIGAVTENVTVTAGADVITATTAQVSNTVSPQQIASLPLITRNPLSLILLQAGTTSNPSQNTTINGMRTTMTNITRDGINIQDTFIRTNATDFAPGRPSVDDTGEFTITTSNSEADQGYGGAQVRLVTPRGSQDFHGGLFAYNRNSRFAANNFFNNRAGTSATTGAPVTPRPFRNRNQYGGKFGGPLPLPHFGEGGAAVIKDKGFFFFAFEGIKDPLSTRSTRTILSTAARNRTFQFTRATAGAATSICPGAAAGTLCTVPDILAFARGLGGTFSTIPATTDPLIQSRILNLLPTAPNAPGGDGLNTLGFALNRQSNQERNTYTGRIDIDVDANNSINGVYSFNRESNLRPDADTTKFTVTPGVIQFSANKTLALAYRHTFGSSLVNEVRGGFFKSDVPFNRTDATPDNFLTIPLVTFPENNFLSQGRNTRGYNVQDNADLLRGKHSIKFGGQLQYFAVDAYNDAAIVPVYTVGVGTATPQFAQANFTPAGGTTQISTTDLGTANGLLGLLGGVVNGGAQSFNTTSRTSGFSATRLFQPFRYSNHSLYAQDRWQLRQNLTITLGLRYELFPALTLDNGLALEPVLDVNNPLASILSRNGTYDFIGVNSGKKNYYYKTDYNNFAPSVGIAYTPRAESGIFKFLFGNRDTVLRGGYSQIYGNDSIVTSINNAAAGNVGIGRTGSNAINAISGTTALNDRLSTGLTAVNPPTFITPPRTYLQNNSQAVAGNFGTVFAVDPNIEIPRVDQYSFGIQRQFGATALEIRYVGTRSKNLARSIDYNQVDIFNNGLLADFNRAATNLALPGATTAFCNPATVTGCQALTIFQNGGTPGAGRLVVGTGGLSATTFNNSVRNGTPADLAISFVTNGLNNHPTVANPTATPFINLLPNPGTGVANLFTNGGYYNYNSVQAEVRRRLTKGLYFQANYTFSKNLTDAIGTSQALVEPFLDLNNPKLDKQRADYDQTHVFNFNAIYGLPFGKGRKFLSDHIWQDRLFGGFELSSIINWASGAPLTFIDTRGTLNRTGRSGRQTVNSSLTNQQIQALVGHFENANGIYYINPSIINPATGRAAEGFGSTAFSGQAFTNVNPGQTGNLGRALIDGPSYFTWNAALLKNIRLTEKTRIQLRMEAFNVLNHTNFVPATQFPSITSSTFGQLTGAFNAREMQFAARFEF